ncbi:MAG: J domain-containing protein [Vicinamibacterales bacterium]
MDYYVVLGVSREASAQQIRRAYQRLARRFHPDVNPGDQAAAERYQVIVRAFETLTDPERRHQYDAGESRATAPGVAPRTFAFEGFDFTVATDAARASTFSELFGDVLTQAAGLSTGRVAERGADLHCDVRLPFEDALRGATRTIAVLRLDRCPACDGHGRVRVPDTPCQSCAGTGTVRGARGHLVFARPCPSCDGSGVQLERACQECHGDGLTPRTELSKVTIPAGAVPGLQLRLADKGNAGRRGGRPGDLIVRVSVDEHPWLTRDGDDLRLRVPVTLHELTLGAKVDIPTLEGTCKLRIPPGAQPGQRLRLRERGAPLADGRVRGDLIVELALVLPRLADERSKELMREFAALNPQDVRAAWMATEGQE